HHSLACGEFIQALEACHAKGMLYRFSGACNGEKELLVRCLHAERMGRAAKNREESIDKNKKKYDAWARRKAELSEINDVGEVRA
ncbi:hypothetical protein BD324DRAFT_577500, partial [Kockovaella imperatae]